MKKLSSYIWVLCTMDLFNNVTNVAERFIESIWKLLYELVLVRLLLSVNFNVIHHNSFQNGVSFFILAYFAVSKILRLI